MICGRIIQHLICSFLVVVTTAASSSYKQECNGSVAIGTAPGVSTTVTIPVDLMCDMAVLQFPEQDPVDLDINENCTSTHTHEQTFEIQLSDTSPLGEARIMFLCGDLSDTFCVRLKVMEPTVAGGQTSRFDTNSVRSLCSDSDPAEVPSPSSASSNSLQPSQNAAQSALPTSSSSAVSTAMAQVSQFGSMGYSAASSVQSVIATSSLGSFLGSETTALYPSDVATLYPSGSGSPYPSGGDSPYPSGGDSPYPSGGDSPYPSGGTSLNPSTINSPYPSVVSPTTAHSTATVQPPPAESSQTGDFSPPLAPLPGPTESVTNIAAGQPTVSTASPGGCTCVNTE